ncbi:AAA family ATPase [Methanobacterium sp.]|uniref:AAA family ATPase n=1 Tax=Methanobacterium sp. TaxID=2164 RepID=UPI003C793D01
MKKIGFLYVKGALPMFEDFGNLPTHIVRNNGMINGFKIHKELDGLIIPGGSIIESQSVSEELKKEIIKMDTAGKFILGMCSGFQFLSNKTDIGRKSPCPINREGLGLLDVSFSPMVGTDRVKAKIIKDSFLTEGMVGKKITGFHCHTYGNITGDAEPILKSLVKRTNYANDPREILSGVRNDDGNVVGLMVHGALDENHDLVRNVLKFIDADENDILKIKNANKTLLNKIKMEIGVETGINIDKSVEVNNSVHKSSTKIIMIASTGSDSGKTFITTGIVGALIKQGYKVGVLKVGPDIRDIVPSLYLNKEKMENFSSIKIGGLGWKDLKEVFEDLKKNNYDIVIVEGVMSIFTGMLNKKVPFSSAEIAIAANIPVIMVSPCNKGGIETAAVDVVSHVEMMNKMGINTAGIILNKVYDEGIAESTSQFIKDKTKTEFLTFIPKIQLTERGNMPEVEIKLDDFCLNAMETAQNYLDIGKIIKLAEEPKFNNYMEFKEIIDRFTGIKEM